MPKYIIAAASEIPPGGRKIVEVAGRSIGVFNLAGEFFALRNRCPHQGGPLCEGKTFGRIQARVPGAIEYSHPGEILTCAWHGWEFDIRTGRSWCAPEKLRVRRYEVSVAPGEALLPDPTPDDDAPLPGRVRGPYLAETYPVSAEGSYLVIEIAG